MTLQSQTPKQLTLFAPSIPSTLDVAGPNVPCDVAAIQKRRDGGTRYWCRAHRADATAKGGTMAARCRRADIVPIQADETLTLDITGGVALWGAVPAVYDTTRKKMDRGIHVHARLTPESLKEMDWTYQVVRLVGHGLPEEGVVISEIDAIYYMVSSIFNFPMTFITCTQCRWPHLDKDWFSVHPHRRHLCAGCGKYFHDRMTGIGNPIIGVLDALCVGEHRIAPAQKTLDINQSEYPGGIQIWGSNPAFLWTQPKPEEEGIHVHTFQADSQTEPTIDGTFREVTIDGIRLDPVMVRVLMAQKVMPSLENRVRSMNCTNCGHSQFDLEEAAYTPLSRHTCSECNYQFRTSGRLRNVVANPLPAILTELSKLAPRPPQEHRLGLLPETL